MTAEASISRVEEEEEDAAEFQAVSLPVIGSTWKSSLEIELAVYEWAYSNHQPLETRYKNGNLLEIVCSTSNPNTCTWTVVALREGDQASSWKIVSSITKHSHQALKASEWSEKKSSILGYLARLSAQHDGEIRAGQPSVKSEKKAVMKRKISGHGEDEWLSYRLKKTTAIAPKLFPAKSLLKFKIHALLEVSQHHSNMTALTASTESNPRPALPGPDVGFADTIIATTHVHAYAASRGFELFRFSNGSEENGATFRCFEGKGGIGIPKHLRCEYRIELEVKEDGLCYIQGVIGDHSHDLGLKKKERRSRTKSFNAPGLESGSKAAVDESSANKKQHSAFVVSDDEHYAMEEDRFQQNDARDERVRNRSMRRHISTPMPGPSTPQTFTSAYAPPSPLIPARGRMDRSPSGLESFSTGSSLTPLPESYRDTPAGANSRLSRDRSEDAKAIVTVASSLPRGSGGALSNDSLSPQFASALRGVLERQGAGLNILIPSMMALGIDSIGIFVNILARSPQVFEDIMAEETNLSQARKNMWRRKVYDKAQQFAS